MTETGTQRFPITFEPWYRWLSTIVGIAPSRSYLEVSGDEVAVRMSWAFSARFPRASVVKASPAQARPVSRGVHGAFGRWLVNGAGRGILSVHLEPNGRAYLMGFPVRLRELMISVSDPLHVANVLMERNGKPISPSNELS